LPHHDRRIPSYCEIRALPVQNPFYTYCANHPYRRPQRDPIPIGPMLGGDAEGDRWITAPSPDSETIRRRRLDLLASPPREQWYPLGPTAGQAVIGQLVEFREPRAAPLLEALAVRAEAEGGEDEAAAGLRRAIALIRAAPHR